MKHVYMDSRLQTLALPVREGIEPGNWVFSQGRPWLLLTPRRLRRLAEIAGSGDSRVDDVLVRFHRETVRPGGDGKFPLAICPVCDSPHRPHPTDAVLACPACRAREEKRRLAAPTPPMEEDMRRDAEAREVFRKNFPGAFVDGELSPNWRYNYERRLERDWEAALGRILTGGTYRRVAREFGCSVGLLHKRVTERAPERKHWESN